MAVAAGSPVSVAVYTVLNVAGFTALGTFHGDHLDQAPTYPCSFYQVRGEEENRGLGTGSLPRVEIWVHGLDGDYEGMKRVQDISSKAKDLLSDAALTVSGFTHAGRVFFDRIVDLPASEVNGKVVRESVAQFYTWVEA